MLSCQDDCKKKILLLKVINFGCVYFSDRTKRTGPDRRYKIRTAGPDQISLLKGNVHSLAISDLRKFRHLNLINLQVDTDTRTGATSSYKENFSSKEAV